MSSSPGPSHAPDPASSPGAGLVRVDLVGTVMFTVTSVAAAVLLRPALQAPAATVAGLLFVGGCGTFAWGFLAAVERSRTQAVELSSLFFLSGSAPTDVRRRLIGLLAAQTVVAMATAAVRPFTSLAFGVLAPVWGLGLITLWAGRHGSFPTKGAGGPPPGGDPDASASSSEEPASGAGGRRNQPQ